MSSKKPTLEDVRVTLETARSHIETKWVAKKWFEWVDPLTDKKEDDGEVPKNVVVTGVCLAGSVLYSLDYLDEQWTGKAKVVPVIEALYDNLPPRSHPKKQAQAHFKGWPSASDNDIYRTKLDAVIKWNDTKGRKKQDVLDLFDRTIKDVVARTPLRIEEQP